MIRNFTVAMVASLLTGAAAAGTNPFGLIGGTYSSQHEVFTLTNDVAVEDKLTLEHEDEGYRFSLLLHHSFNQQCRLEGFATMAVDERSGVTTLSYAQPTNEVKTKRCMLTILINDETIALNDPNETCSDACGMGGMIDGTEFSRATRE